jgi:hypothetical protein
LLVSSSSNGPSKRKRYETCVASACEVHGARSDMRCRVHDALVYHFSVKQKMNRRNNEQSAGRLTARSTARPDTEFQYRSQRPDHPPASLQLRRSCMCDGHEHHSRDDESTWSTALSNLSVLLLDQSSPLHVGVPFALP